MVSFKNKKTIYKKLIVFLLIAGIGTFLVVNSSGAVTSNTDWIKGSGTPVGDGKLTKIADYLISGMLQIMQAVAGFILGVGMAVVDLAISDKLFTAVFFSNEGKAAINTGWSLVRDFVNMFFILILIFVAIATILRVNKFSDKKFIMYVVTAALFVNFSKPITLFVIDISNLAMSFFMSNINPGSQNSYASALLASQNMSDSFTSNVSSGGRIGLYVAWMVEIIFKIIMGMMLLGLGISLIVRLVALCVLIVLSPLAFFAIALPGTALGNVKDKWVSNLTSWAFYGPIMLFFFWLALVMVSAATKGIAGGEAELQLSSVNFAGKTENFIVGALKSLIPFITSIYLLYYGFDLSKQMASSAGNGAVWSLNKVGGGISKGLKTAGVVGTLGAGYWGYRKSKEVGGVLRDRVKGDLEERKAGRIARTPGSKTNVKDHRQKLMNEELKNWDNDGAPKADELKKVLKGKSSLVGGLARDTGMFVDSADKKVAIRQAAAMKLSEGADLKVGDESYGRAYNAIKDDPNLLAKFEKNIKKKNLHQKLEFDTTENIESTLDSKVAARNTDTGTVMDAAAEASFRSSTRANLKETEYAEQLKKMSMKDITEQSTGFLKEKEFQDYMKANTGAKGTEGTNRFTDEKIKKAVADLDNVEKQKVFMDNNFFA